MTQAGPNEIYTLYPAQVVSWISPLFAKLPDGIFGGKNLSFFLPKWKSEYLTKFKHETNFASDSLNREVPATPKSRLDFWDSWKIPFSKL